jgi:N-terminal domain of unknown function (DUF4140)
LAFAQLNQFVEPAPATRCQEAKGQLESTPAPRPAPSKITAATVYQGQALVTREVTVPEGTGTVELVGTPLPPQTIDSSLYAEGADGLRVLSTRFRSRAVKDDAKAEVRGRDELAGSLEAEAQPCLARSVRLVIMRS